MRIAWRTLRSHDFDTITCVRRCERAVMFFVTSLCFGRYASGAWISCTLRVHTCTCMCAHSPLAHLCAHVCTLSGTYMCERVHVHVSAPAGCMIFFFVAHSPLRSAARETTLRVVCTCTPCAHVRTPACAPTTFGGSASLPKTPHFVVDRFARASRIPACRPSRKKIAARGCQRSWVCEV